MKVFALFINILKEPTHTKIKLKKNGICKKVDDKNLHTRKSVLIIDKCIKISNISINRRKQKKNKVKTTV